MMSFLYNVREYKIGDESKILELLDLVFERENTLDFWRWKYFDNPLKKQIIVIAEHDNRIVGCTHSFSREVKIGDNMHQTSFGADSAVHPDFRRQGIYGKLTDLREKIILKQGFNIHSAITTNPIVKNYRDSRGQKHFPKRIIEAIYIEDIWKEDVNVLKKIGYQFYESGKKIMNPNIGDDSDYVVSQVEHFGVEADIFWDKIKDYYLFIFKRDKDNLNWRYCDPRTIGFKMFNVVHNGELLGYCVTTISRSGDSFVGYIIDLCALPNMDDVVAVLLRKALDVLLVDVNMVKYWIFEEHPLLSVFHSFGFISRPSDLDYSYWHTDTISDDIETWYNTPVEKWFIQYGDTDIL
jgi:hypothetical protein